MCWMSRLTVYTGPLARPLRLMCWMSRLTVYTGPLEHHNRCTSGASKREIACYVCVVHSLGRFFVFQAENLEVLSEDLATE